MTSTTKITNGTRGGFKHETCDYDALNNSLHVSIHDEKHRLSVHSGYMNVSRQLPYANFLLYINRPLDMFDKFRLLVLDKNGRNVPYPPLHVHHNHVNSEFHMFEVHGDYFPDWYERSLPPGRCIGMNDNLVLEGVVNLVTRREDSVSFKFVWEFYKALRSCRPVSKIWFHPIGLSYDCWNRYNVTLHRPQVWSGIMPINATYHSGAWLHTHRARSRSIFLFEGVVHLPQESSEAEKEALVHRDLICSEIHRNVDDVSYHVDGEHYDKHGTMNCTPWFFRENQPYTLMVTNYPFFHRDVSPFLQHTNLFMYVDVAPHNVNHSYIVELRQ